LLLCIIDVNNISHLIKLKLGDAANLDDVKRFDKLGKIKRHIYRPTFKDTWQVPTKGFIIIRSFI